MLEMRSGPSVIDTRRTQKQVDRLANIAAAGYVAKRKATEKIDLARPTGVGLKLSNNWSDQIRTRSVDVPLLQSIALIEAARTSRNQQALFKRMRKHPFVLTDED